MATKLDIQNVHMWIKKHYWCKSLRKDSLGKREQPLGGGELISICHWKAAKDVLGQVRLQIDVLV